MVSLERHGENFIVSYDHLPIGTVELYHNPYHAENCYLRLNLSHYPQEISKALFSHIAQQVQQPLQIMLPSTETEQIAFLQGGGFFCRRKCYEVEAALTDFIIEGKTIAKRKGVSPKGKHISNRNIYEKYSERGAHGKHGNFLTYIERADGIFRDEKYITRDTKRHMQKIRSAITPQ